MAGEARVPDQDPSLCLRTTCLHPRPRSFSAQGEGRTRSLTAIASGPSEVNRVRAPAAKLRGTNATHATSHRSIVLCTNQRVSLCASLIITRPGAEVHLISERFRDIGALPGFRPVPPPPAVPHRRPVAACFPWKSLDFWRDFVVHTAPDRVGCGRRKKVSPVVTPTRPQLLVVASTTTRNFTDEYASR